MSTKIEWATDTWNPTTGCTKVSPGCANCYIERQAPMRIAGRRFVRGAIPIELHPERLQVPLHWYSPRRVFVDSMSDLFHEDVPEKYIAKVLAVCELAYWHQFLILTKRPERMRALLTNEDFQFHIGWFASQAMREFGLDEARFGPHVTENPPNVWLGTTAENQRMAARRVPELLATPAAVHFVSLEPLLSPIDLRPWIPYGEPCEIPHSDIYHGHCSRCGESEDLQENDDGLAWSDTDHECPPGFGPSLDWVITGGESGGPDARRLVEQVRECVEYDVMRTPHNRYAKVWKPKPAALEMVRSLRDQCEAAGVAFFFKQWGGPHSKSGGRELDGREWSDYPL